MGKPSNSKRGFNTKAFVAVAHCLAGEPFNVQMMHDAWFELNHKQVPSRTQISMLLRGDQMRGVYLVQHHSDRNRTIGRIDGLGRNSIYAICDQWLAENPLHYLADVKTK